MVVIDNTDAIMVRIALEKLAADYRKSAQYLRDNPPETPGLSFEGAASSLAQSADWADEIIAKLKDGAL